MQRRRGKSRRSRRTHTLVSVVERRAATAARHAEAAAGRDAGQPGPLPAASRRRGERGGDIAMPVSCKYSNNSAGSPPAARRGGGRRRVVPPYWDATQGRPNALLEQRRHPLLLRIGRQ
uniref:Uncharacterized protein n=1 Tax=Oryza sativa subsp. japonica TaxID=39947 RepID=Q6ZF64_ORYSJ|nr:hypothetical protein [Oryza sativa Japonica Group]